MASHGLFAKDAPYRGGGRGGRGRDDSYRGGGGKQGRKVNFHSQHDDRWDGGSSNQGGRDNYDRGGYSNRSRGGGRGRGDGQWTRGRGNRGGRGRGGYNDRGGSHGDRNYSNRGGNYDDRNHGDNYDNEDYGYQEGGGNKSYKGKNRFTPYTKSPPSGDKSRGVFNRLGGPSRSDSSRGNFRGNRGNRDSRGRGGRGRDDRDHGDRRISFQRMESDNVMEEDPSTVIMQVLGERFDTVNMSLNLSDMFHDKILQEHKIRSSMYDVAFVSSVLDLIATHCPTLKALDLSRNKLQRLQAYSQLREKCPYLQILDLSNNELRSPQELEVIGPMTTVTALMLENNSFNTHDFGGYAGAVRKSFPNLELLDGQPLPGPIKFDLPSSVGTIPPSQKGYLVNEDVRTLVLSFLEQFYSLYDGETRDKLLEAYSDNAVFSMSVDMSQQQRGPPFHQYIQNSRNLVKVNDSNKRFSLLKHGRIDIVQCLRQFPQSHHIASTFSVDVMKANPMSTGFTVYGLFGEASTSNRGESYPVRAFVRTFVIVAAVTGVAIVNDQLTIRNASMASVKQYSDEVQSHFTGLQPSLPLIPSQSSSLSGPSSSGAHSSLYPPPPPSQLMGQQHQQMMPPQFNNEDEMVQRLGLDTGMNYSYARKCLFENGWNYDKALSVFRMFQEQGKIPPEAFHSETYR